MGAITLRAKQKGKRMAPYYYTSSVRILLHIQHPHTTLYVSSYYYICVRILLKVLVTMRNSCNRDLLERSTHVYDWDPVFLDDALDRIIGAALLPLYCLLKSIIGASLLSLYCLFKSSCFTRPSIGSNWDPPASLTTPATAV